MADSHRTLNGDENSWIEFSKSGYPFRLARELRDTKRESETILLIAKYITACHVPTLDGNWVEEIKDEDALLDVDEQLVVEIIRQFYAFRQERMYSPLEKNS